MKQPLFMVLAAAMIIIAIPMMFMGFNLARIYNTLWIAPVPTMLCMLCAGVCTYLAENY